VAAAIHPGLPEQIMTALAGWQAETMCLAALPDLELAALVDEIYGFVRLTGGGWPADQRKQFAEQCIQEFAGVPVSLLLPAIQQARKTVYQPGRFVSWVFELIEPKLRLLELEGDRLKRLAEHCG
jgi:hypothetical protein